MNLPTGSDRDVDLRQAQALTESGALLLDVREPDEWAAGHAPAATHTPLGLLDPTALPADRVIVAVCRSGNRSGKATDSLRAAGLDAHNLTGGMIGWAAAGLPVVTNDGGNGTIA
jgi:rhodanese-related sulfurtransferase